MMNEKKESLLSEMKNFIVALGFEKVCIGDEKLNYFKYNNGYDSFDYSGERYAIVIQATPNYD